MPYIKDYQRKALDPIVEDLADHVKPTGALNYILFAYAKKIKPSYNHYKELIGELHCTITEIERRLLAPYEDKKIKENGDIE